MDRVLRSAGGTIEITNYDATGAPADVGGAWTAKVTDSAGVEIAGSPFPVVDEPGTGVYGFALPTDLDTLDVYSVLWNAGDGTKRRSQFEVVGGFYFTVADAQAFDPDMAATDAELIVAAREAIEERIEENTGKAFVPRGQRERLDGTGNGSLMLKRALVLDVVAVTADDVALDAGELAEIEIYPTGVVVWTGGSFAFGVRNVEVLYEYGFETCPASIKRAALQVCLDYLQEAPAGKDGRRTVEVTDVGSFRLSIAGRDGPFGLPDVDAVLDQFGGAGKLGFY